MSALVFLRTCVWGFSLLLHVATVALFDGLHKLWLQHCQHLESTNGSVCQAHVMVFLYITVGQHCLLT